MDSKMKLLAAALAGVFAMGQSVRAEEESSPAQATLDVTAASAYVWRGQLLVDDPVLQPSLTVSKNGFAINWWGNFNFDDNATGDDFEFSEHDISLSYATECPLTGAALTFGVVNYDFPNVSLVDADGNVSLVNDTVEAYAIAAFDVVLAPTVSLYYDFKEADGFYASLGVSHAVTLAEEVNLNLGASIGGATEDWQTYYYGVDEDGATDWSVSATIPFAVGEGWTVTPGVLYTALIGDAQDAVEDGGLYLGEDDNVVGTLKVSYLF